MLLVIVLVTFSLGRGDPLPLAEMDPAGFPDPKTGCLASAKCHGSIEPISKKSRLQIPPIPDLPMDYAQVLTRDDRQLQTVGHHWPLSGPLPKEVRDRMEKIGTCLRCHKTFPTGAFKDVHKKDFHAEIMGNLLKLARSFHDLCLGTGGNK